MEATRLPTLSVLGQDYTVDVQAGIVRNVVYTSEMFTFARFRDIVEQAAAIAEVEGDAKRLTEARRILRDFGRIIDAGQVRDAETIQNDAERGDGGAPRRARKRDRDR